MAAYFASDVHLRPDRPERARRFARFVGGLRADDSLVIAGDLCDFWAASRARRDELDRCEGLRALVDFRWRGGSLAALAGNHDAALGPTFERLIGVGFVPEPLEVEAFGVRVHAVHGHRVGARPAWKAGMESRAFLHGFGHLPAPLARGLDDMLWHSNEKTKTVADERHRARYRLYASGLDGGVDIAVFGHIHGPFDDGAKRPRLVVLGGWHDRSSFLRIDEGGARLVIEEDSA